MVALFALLAVYFSGTVPTDRIFLGFAHPAVITVAAVLVISRGLQNSGLVDFIARGMLRIGKRPTLQIAALTFLVIVLSGFMNNVGALALLMPVAIHMARKAQHSPSIMLMPLAFGSLLGGLLTLIGTPPNIIIGTFRGSTNIPPFSMFDYTPVGLCVALIGMVFIILGWKLIPVRKGQASSEEMFHIEEYTTEVRIPEDSKFVGKPLNQLEALGEGDVAIIGLIRGNRRFLAPSGFETIWANDLLIVEASPESLKSFVDIAKVELVGNDEEIGKIIKSEEVSLFEAVVAPRSQIVGRNARSLHMRWRYGINLLAVARQGERLKERLARIRFEVGDVLLLQGPSENIQDTLSTLGCLPLARRELRLGQKRRIILSIVIFGIAIALTVFGLLPVDVAFTGAALAMVLFNLLSINDVYRSIEWPVVVLLGAMIPLGEAMYNTGGAMLIGMKIAEVKMLFPPSVILGLLLAISITLSNVMNNAAVAVLMAPIAVSVANELTASPDPFLMTVAVGSSCTFLTPIGHQSNALVMGPGGYHFGDYWRLGLPLTIVVMLVTVPVVMHFWPLYKG